MLPNNTEIVEITTCYVWATDGLSQWLMETIHPDNRHKKQLNCVSLQLYLGVYSKDLSCTPICLHQPRGILQGSIMHPYMFPATCGSIMPPYLFRTTWWCTYLWFHHAHLHVSTKPCGVPICFHRPGVYFKDPSCTPTCFHPPVVPSCTPTCFHPPVVPSCTPTCFHQTLWCTYQFPQTWGILQGSIMHPYMFPPNWGIHKTNLYTFRSTLQRF